MAQDDDKQRTKLERIERLRERLKQIQREEPGRRSLIGILQGVLDLLADEL